MFTHESGIHVAGMLKNRAAFEPFPPADVGAEPTRYVAGKHTGSGALAHILAGLGIEPARDEVARLVPEVRRLAGELKRSLTPDEIVGLHESLRLENAAGQAH